MFPQLPFAQGELADSCHFPAWCSMVSFIATDQVSGSHGTFRNSICISLGPYGFSTPSNQKTRRGGFPRQIDDICLAEGCKPMTFSAMFRTREALMLLQCTMVWLLGLLVIGWDQAWHGGFGFLANRGSDPLELHVF